MGDYIWSEFQRLMKKALDYGLSYINFIIASDEKRRKIYGSYYKVNTDCRRKGGKRFLYRAINSKCAEATV